MGAGTMDASELPLRPRQRTTSFYVALFCLIIPFWSFIPLCWLYAVYISASGGIWSLTWPGQVLFAVAFGEVVFSIYHFHLSRVISRLSPHAPGDLQEIQAAFKRLLQSGLAHLPADGGDEESYRPGSPEEDIIQLEHDDPRAVDFRNALRPWFCNMPWSSIKLYQVQQWLYWSIYNADMPAFENLPASQRAVVNHALDLLQKRCGCVFEQSSNLVIQPMRVTIDKVNILWRPFGLYFTLYIINLCLRKWFEVGLNVQSSHYDGLEYLIRVPKHWDPVSGPRPLVFIHGLGLGLLQYNSVLRHMFQQFSDRPMLVLLQPQISQNLFHPRFLKPMSRHETADQLARLLVRLGWVHSDLHEDKEVSDSEEEKEIIYSLLGKLKKGVTMLSHSNGSYVHAWMLKSYPKLVQRSCFVDPVTFCSWEGDVCFNFLYRQPKTAMELLMHCFVATELGVSNLLQRHFDWASNTLWFEEIPNARNAARAFFLLGGNDSILHSQRVKRYLTSHGVKEGIWYDPHGSHGQALSPGTHGHLEILRWVREVEI